MPPLLSFAINNQFGESGKKTELFKKFGLDAPHIVKVVEQYVKQEHGNEFWQEIEQMRR